MGAPGKLTPAIVEFTARGSARAVASAIETCAAERRGVSALVVPWESDATTLRMAVTATTGDGWAIEHTNLGTITLANLGGNRTEVVVLADSAPDDDAGHDQPSCSGPRGALVAFARRIEQRLASQPASADPRV